MSAGTSTLFEMPVRTVNAARRAIPKEGVDQVVVNYLTVDLVLVALMQKVAIPIGSSQLTSVVLPHFATLALLAYRGRVHLSMGRFLMFCLTFGMAGLFQFLHDGPVNWMSYFLGLICYWWLALIVRANRATYIAFLKRFQYVAFGVACLVFFDHVMQVVGPGMPNLNKVFPEAWNYKDFVYIQPLYYGAQFLKPNAIFFLEVSQTSQFIAIGLVIELALFRRFRFLATFIPALMSTFAGTGLVLFALCVPMLAVRLLKPKIIVFGMIAVPLVVALALASGWVDILSKRSDEFSQHGSSANGRFIAPFVAMADQVRSGDVANVMTGVGAGQLEKTTDLLHIPLSKAFLEYGFPFVVLFMIYFNYVTFGGGVPFVVAWAGMLQYQVLNGSFLVPVMIIYTYLLSGAWKLEPEPKRSRAQRMPAETRLRTTGETPAIAGRGAFG